MLGFLQREVFDGVFRHFDRTALVFYSYLREENTTHGAQNSLLAQHCSGRRDVGDCCIRLPIRQSANSSGICSRRISAAPAHYSRDCQTPWRDHPRYSRRGQTYYKEWAYAGFTFAWISGPGKTWPNGVLRASCRPVAVAPITTMRSRKLPSGTRPARISLIE